MKTMKKHGKTMIFQFFGLLDPQKGPIGPNEDHFFVLFVPGSLTGAQIVRGVMADRSAQRRQHGAQMRHHGAKEKPKERGPKKEDHIH